MAMSYVLMCFFRTFSYTDQNLVALQPRKNTRKFECSFGPAATRGTIFYLLIVSRLSVRVWRGFLRIFRIFFSVIIT